MIVSSAFKRLETTYHQLIHDYCIINHRSNELQFVCNNDGEVLTISGPEPIIRQISETNSSPENLYTFFKASTDLIAKSKGCVIRTELPVCRPFSSILSTNGFDSDSLKITLFPLFYSPSTQNLVNISVKLIQNNFTQALPHSKPRKESIAHCLIETQTGLILEYNEAFERLVGQSNETIAKSRCEELGLKDLLLLATLNADRRCLFPAQINLESSNRHLVQAERLEVGNRTCIRLWFPQGSEIPCTSHSLTESLSYALLDLWHDKPSKVLICDDNELLLDSCSSIMTWAKIQFRLAKNGKDALEQLEKQDFDAVLLDLNMPRLNGFDTAKIIKQSKKSYCNTPLIAMTATPFNEAGYGNQLKHFDSFLKKPFDIEDIRTAIQTAVAKTKRTASKQNELAPNNRVNPVEINSDYIPTSFMKKFRHSDEKLESFRNSILHALRDFEKNSSEYHYKRMSDSYTVLLQRAQSMAKSIGAIKLAEEIEQISLGYCHANSIDQTKLHDKFQQQLDEAQIFFNQVEWKTFIPEKEASNIHIAA